VKCIGLYPRVRADMDGAGVVSQSGGVALVETARAAGLDRGLSMALARWRKPMAVHDPGKVITDLAGSPRVPWRLDREGRSSHGSEVPLLCGAAPAGGGDGRRRA
jgi:Transposase DDE domain group 1